MKTKNSKLYFLALLTGFVFVLGACKKESDPSQDLNSSSSELKSNQGPSANGQGQFVWNNALRHFSFHANTMPNGSVKGSGVVNYNGPDNFQAKFSIDCLNIVGNQATMSGAVTSSNNPDWPAGAPVAFSVVDNGEGSGSAPDQITLLQQSPDYDCYTWPGLWLNDITGGNIQVKP